MSGGAECSPGIRIAFGAWNHAHRISVSSPNPRPAPYPSPQPGTAFVTKSEHSRQGWQAATAPIADFALRGTRCTPVGAALRSPRYACQSNPNRLGSCLRPAWVVLAGLNQVIIHADVVGGSTAGW